MSSRFRSATLPAALALLALAAPASAQLVTPRVSPNASVSQTIGITDVSVKYCRPGVKGRPIWGQLVPYGQTWRTGANEATLFTTSTDITVNGQKLPAGAYALFTIPTEKDWTVVFNSDKEQFGAFAYKPEHDVLRVTVTPTSAEPEEWMRFSFEGLTPNSAVLSLRWEKLEVPLTLTADVNALVLAGAREAVTKAANDGWRTPYQAANWCFTNDQALTDGAAWLEQSLAVRKTYQNLGLKARWLAKDGRTKEAVATAQQALALARDDPSKPDTASLEKAVAEWSAKKK